LYILVLDTKNENGWQWKTTARRGIVVDMILKIVDENRPDLFVMASLGFLVSV
jgi:hypothetical protein